MWRAITITLAVVAFSAPAAWAGGVPVQFALGHGSVWATSDAGLRVLDARTGRVVGRPSATYAYSTEVALGAGAAWIASIANGYIAGAVDRIDLRTRRETVALRSPRRGIDAIAFGGNALWALLAQPKQPLRFLLARVDARTGHVRYLPINGSPGWIAAARDGVWVSDANVLRFVHGTTGRIERVAKLNNGGLLTVGLGSIWVASGKSVLRFDERTHRRVATISTGAYPAALAASAGRVWVAAAERNARLPRLLRIDAATDRVAASRALRGFPTSVGADRTHVWIGLSGVRPRLLRLDASTLRQQKIVTLAGA